MRLIDIDALIEEIDEEIEYGTERYEKHFDDADKYITKGLRIARKDILGQPVIEAGLVNRGKMTVRELNKVFNEYCNTEIKPFRNGQPLLSDESIIADLEVKAITSIKEMKNEPYMDMETDVIIPGWSILVLEVEVE